MNGLSNHDLIIELRDWAEVEGAGSLSNILNEAADRIEALDERVAIMEVEDCAERGEMHEDA